MHVGIDFGTSNTMVAHTGSDGKTHFLEYDLLGAKTSSFRSLLFFDPEEQEMGEPIAYHAGTRAIEAYLEAMGEGRLIQSFKTHLTAASLGRTQIGHHAVSLDDMLRLFFVRLREYIHAQWGGVPDRVTMGRPVNFVGAADEAANLAAQARLAKAAEQTGFKAVEFRLEPIAAAYHYEQRIQAPELVLVADFGGGTTDFCLMRLGGAKRTGNRADDIVATGGVGVAGDDLDAAIIDHVVSPQLGKGTKYKEMGRVAAIPSSYYHKLSRWHQLSFLRGKRTRDELQRLHRAAEHPEAIAALMHVIETNQGFHLHKAVEQLKIALSNQDEGRFEFIDEEVEIRVPVARADFEQWIAPTVDAMVTTLDELLAGAKVNFQDVDRVFMTGGTAFVPCVRRAFAQRFGADKLSGGEEMLSIASGLACGV